MAVDSFWNDERVAELKRLWTEENLSGTQIAAAMGLKDRNAVMGKIHRLGITRKIVAAVDGEAAPRPKGSKPVAAETRPAAASTVETPVPQAQEVAPSPAQAAEPTAEPDAIAGHPVMQLKERSCRWPIGDPQRPGFRFCCAERLGSFPYCAEHAEISYMPSDRQARRTTARDKAA